MELDFLAQRVTKRGWLRVKAYRKSVTAFRVISLIRTIISAVFLAVILPEDSQVTEGARRRLNALGALSLLFAAVDWIPYRVYTWQRQPTILTRWATPASGAASILANIALVLVAWATGERFLAMLALGFAICGMVAMNMGLLCFVYCGPVKLPPLYQPVRKDAGQYEGDDGPASADTSIGPLARLYQAQMSSSRGMEVGRADSPQQASKLILTSQSANTANFNPTLVFWHRKMDSAFAWIIMVFLGLWSAVHIVVQIVRYFMAKRNGESCDSVCILHLVYPPLWIFFILVTCVLIRTRVDLRKQLLWSMTLSKVLCTTFFAILAVCVVDFAFTGPGIAMFKNFYAAWMIFNGLALALLFILGVGVVYYYYVPLPHS